MTRELTTKERQLLLFLTDACQISKTAELKAQVAKTRIGGGPLTMLELVVDRSAAPIPQKPGPLPLTAYVTDVEGEPMGELLLWTTDGYLSQLEYAWYTDIVPTELPDVAQIVTEIV